MGVHTSDEADRTQLADGRRPETDQPVVILEDVGPLPVTGEYGRCFANEIWALAMAEGYRAGSSIPQQRLRTVFRICYKKH